MPSRVALRTSGKPPVKTTTPLGRDQLAKLGALEIQGMTKTVRKVDDAFLDVEYRYPSPEISVIVTVQPCLRCLPMQVDKWRAQASSLRVTIPPDLRERGDTTFEIESISIGGTPAILTHQRGWIVKMDAPIFDQAVALYFADGVNQLRVIASFDGSIQGELVAADRSTAEPLLASMITRSELEQAALAVLDRYAQAW